MSNGFLGYNTTFMLDFVVCALVLIVPLLMYSLYEVRIRRNFSRHRNLQVAIGFILLAAVGAFEVDVQLIHGGWETIVGTRLGPPDSPAFRRAACVLHVHLIFAVTTPVLWCLTAVMALRRFGSPPEPGRHSRWHTLLGRVSIADIVLTSVTGLLFYYLAFVRP